MSATLLQFRRPAAKRVESKRAGGTRIIGFGLSIQARKLVAHIVATWSADDPKHTAGARS